MLFSLSTAALAFMFAPATVPRHKQILSDAADLVEQKGHARDVLSDGTGYCIQGAIFQAATGSWQWPAADNPAKADIVKAMRAAEIALGRSVSAEDALMASSWRLARWNNMRATKDDVVRVLRKAAA